MRWLLSWWSLQVLPPLCAELRNLVMQPMILPMVLTIAESQVPLILMPANLDPYAHVQWQNKEPSFLSLNLNMAKQLTFACVFNVFPMLPAMLNLRPFSVKDVKLHFILISFYISSKILIEIHMVYHIDKISFSVPCCQQVQIWKVLRFMKKLDFIKQNGRIV